MRHPEGHCEDCGERFTAETTRGIVCQNGHYTSKDSEHFLEERPGLFGKTIFYCRHCNEQSPDKQYFTQIPCPPTINDQ